MRDLGESERTLDEHPLDPAIERHRVTRCLQSSEPGEGGPHRVCPRVGAFPSPHAAGSLVCDQLLVGGPAKSRSQHAEQAHRIGGISDRAQKRERFDDLGTFEERATAFHDEVDPRFPQRADVNGSIRQGPEDDGHVLGAMGSGV